MEIENLRTPLDEARQTLDRLAGKVLEALFETKVVRAQLEEFPESKKDLGQP